MDYVYRHLMSSADLDEAYISKAFDMMMDKEKGLEDYARAVRVVSEESDCLADYDCDTGLIHVYLNKILEDKSITRNKKILTFEALRHEMEHARNIARLYQCRSDIESVVLRASLKKYAIEKGIDVSRTLDKIDPQYYSFKKKENYDVDPDERLAEIMGWKYIVNLLKNQRSSYDLRSARVMLYLSYIKGYNHNRYYLEAPTYQYLLNTGLYHQLYLLRKRVAEQDYCLETRLRCGLPIRPVEFSSDVKKLTKVVRKKQTL